MSPRHIKDPAAPLLRFPRFVGADLHMSQRHVWNEVVFPSMEAAFAQLEDRVERMVRDVVARELARQQSKDQSSVGVRLHNGMFAADGFST